MKVSFTLFLSCGKGLIRVTVASCESLRLEDIRMCAKYCLKAHINYMHGECSITTGQYYIYVDMLCTTRPHTHHLIKPN